MERDRITKLLKPGEKIYSAYGGRPMTVTAVDGDVIETDYGVYYSAEHLKLFYLTKAGYRHARGEEV